MEAAFFAKVASTPDGCWEWTAYRNDDGYGRFNIDNTQRFAHRLAYQHLVGEVPEGTELDHLCGNRGCVNPEHLEPVTHRENVLRGNAPAAQQARQTHCKRGHELDGENLYVEPNGRRRVCRTCKRDYLRNYTKRAA